jgi:aminopeptidase N
MRKLTDAQRVKLMVDPLAEIDRHWLSLYGEIIADRRLSSSLKAYFLRIDEQPMDRDYSTWYPEQVVARERLMKAVNGLYRPQLVDQFKNLDTYSPSRRRSPKDGIEERLLKQVLLELIAVDDTPESHRLVLDHFRAATTANDRVTALAALNRSSAPTRRAVMDEVYQAWREHLSGYANYLRVVSSGTREDVFEMIEAEKKRSSFDITQPTWCRALFLPMAVNNKMVWTDRGIQWVADTVVGLAPINATTASRLLNTFQHVRRLKPELKGKVLPALQRIVQAITPEISPTIHGQADAYVKGDG